MSRHREYFHVAIQQPKQQQKCRYNGCQDCDFYAPCALKNKLGSAYNTCDRCVGTRSREYLSAGDSKGLPYYQKCAMYCYCGAHYI